MIQKISRPVEDRQTPEVMEGRGEKTDLLGTDVSRTGRLVVWPAGLTYSTNTLTVEFLSICLSTRKSETIFRFDETKSNTT